MTVGRPPKATALKLLNGSAAHDPQRINLDEPTLPPLTEVPDPPRDLSSVEAMTAWFRNVPLAIALGTITEADLETFALGCEAFGDYQTALDWRERDAARKFVVATLGKFGLNPSDRTRLHAAPKAKADPMAELIARRNQRKTS